MKQSGHLNPSEETGTGFPVTSKYGRTPPNEHGGVGRQQQRDDHNHSTQSTYTHSHINYIQQANIPKHHSQIHVVVVRLRSWFVSV